MARKCCHLVLGVFLLAAPKASAQFATIDASNLAQNILSFVQDGDNMITNTEQFLQNLGLLEEQLKFLKEADNRIRQVRTGIWKTQEVIRLAQNWSFRRKVTPCVRFKVTPLSDFKMTPSFRFKMTPTVRLKVTPFEIS